METVLIEDPLFSAPVHRDAFCKFPFRWIYYCHSSKSTGKETGKMHLCAVVTLSIPIPIQGGRSIMLFGAYYGNTGCGVFKQGIQNQKDFCIMINISKGDH